MAKLTMEQMERKARERWHRARTKIDYRAPEIHFVIDGVVAATQQLGDPWRVLDVSAGLDFLGTDWEVSIFDFGGSLWIVPDTTSSTLGVDCVEHLRAAGGSHRARIAALPREWMGGGWMGLGRHPVARVLVGGQLLTEDPTWECDEL